MLLGGSASAWFQTLPNETTSDFNDLVGELKKRFGSQNLEFFFRQELYSRKQGQNEPLALYTEDIIKKSQRLSLSDKDMMNIFVNGLNDAIKTHVLLNQPKTFAEAEHLARLRDSVSKTSAHTFPLAPPSVPAQEQRIKELEGQVNLLFSLANKTPHQDAAQLDALSANNTLVTPSQAANPSGDFQGLRHEIIAAIQTGFRQEARKSNHGNNQHNLKATNTFARGRNIRTSDGRPICNACNRVGHVTRYCWDVPQRTQQPPFRGGSRSFAGHGNGGLFLQILNCAGSHWITMSNVFTEQGNVSIYDSAMRLNYRYGSREMRYPVSCHRPELLGRNKTMYTRRQLNRLCYV